MFKPYEAGIARTLIGNKNSALKKIHNENQKGIGFKLVLLSVVNKIGVKTAAETVELVVSDNKTANIAKNDFFKSLFKRTSMRKLPQFFRISANFKNSLLKNMTRFWIKIYKIC